ncbi:MAG TPA: diguanylate cyclase [Longimicrobiales bacterium]|nr:diguanylate cyclase [Longimicrobiales bacterium]
MAPVMPPDVDADPRVLAVDDDPGTLHLIGTVLDRDGMESFTGATGREALELAAQAPDLILLDHHLPDLEGLEVCRLLKADPVTADIPVVMLTADHNPVLEARVLEAGAVDFITKPFAPDVLAARIGTHISLARKTRLLERLANTDPLTGVANRRFFDHALEREWARTQRSQRALALIIVDMDAFKAVNDTYGHQEGDACLRFLPHVLSPHLKRPFDLLARLGGEEFVALLPETDLKGALRLAELMRADVESSFVRLAEERGEGPRVTASFGCAAVVPTREIAPWDLIRIADQNLYKAKASGRNRVEPAGAGPAEAAPTG